MSRLADGEIRSHLDAFAFLSDGVQMVFVDIDDFLSVFLFNGVRNRPANANLLFVVDRTLVVDVVDLDGADHGEESRRIDVVGDQFFLNANVVAIARFKERHAAVIRLRSF